MCNCRINTCLGYKLLLQEIQPKIRGKYTINICFNNFESLEAFIGERNNFFVRPCGFNVSIVRMLEEFRICFFHVIIFFFFKTSHFIGYHCQRKCRRNIPKTAVTHPAALEIGDTGRLSFRT